LNIFLERFFYICLRSLPSEKFTPTVVILLFPLVNFFAQVQDLLLVFFVFRREHVHLCG